MATITLDVPDTWTPAQVEQFKARAVRLLAEENTGEEFPPAGFAKTFREAREAVGDFRPGSEVFKARKEAEEARKMALYKGERE